MSSKEGLERYKQEKLQKRREQRLESYYRNRNLKENEYALSDEAVRQRQHREKQEKEQMRRVKETERKRKYRKRKREENINDQRQNEDLNMRNTFENRTEKHRALKKLKLALPKSPDRRVTTMVAYLQNSNSPTVRKLQSSEVISSPEEIEEHKTSKALTEDLKTVIDNCKRKRSNDSLKTMNVIISSVSGEKISDNKCRKKLARKLGLPVRRVSRGHAIRTRILKSEKSSWTYTNRKTRSDAITPDTKKRIYEFWCKPGISRPTGNKADIKRVRIGPKTYSSHMTHILEKTQTDVYLDFIGENPSIKIAQRMFERCKPYFVRPVRPKDRQTCCCKYHVEFKTVFKSCMEFRKKLLIENEPNECYSTPVYDSISDVVNATLCEKVDGSHNLQCLKRNCSDCGVKILNFLPCELDVSDTAEFVKWEKFENVSVNVKGNKTIKKLMLVKKESQVGELFSYFRKLIETFPVHQHRATWQNEQFQNLVRNLPEKQCVCVHDFSENYRCSELTEIQSAYFQKTEVSVHVTILHRHALLEYDGVDSSEDFPEIITEQFFVISPDLVHDQYFVHQVRNYIAEYLQSISYSVETMHEFTDGCAAQYKSRHCFGDISQTSDDFGYQHFTRNFFETSHAKGPQDAAGGIIKRQADCAILRGQTQIRTAKDLYEYANSFLTQPRSHCKRRIFRYAETIHRDNRLSFKPVPSIRSLHQVRASRDSAKGLINISELSCFCVNCCHHMYDQCSNSIKTGGYTEWEMKREYRADAQENEENEQVSLQELVSVGQLVALYTDDDEEEYYMLKVEKSMETLRIDTTDSWGSLLPAGTPVFRGLYYNKTNSPFQYRLVNRKAVVPAASVVYICSEVTANNVIRITEETHLNVLECINEIKC